MNDSEKFRSIDSEQGVDLDHISMEEKSPQWHHSSFGFFGNKRVYYLTSCIYFLIAVCPMLVFLFKGALPIGVGSPLAMAWAVFVVLAYPSWSWLETIYFEKWVRQLDEKNRNIERYYFNLMSSHSKTFWAALLGIYSVAGIWSLLTR